MKYNCYYTISQYQWEKYFSYICLLKSLAKRNMFHFSNLYLKFLLLYKSENKGLRHSTFRILFPYSLVGSAPNIFVRLKSRKSAKNTKS